MDFEKNNEFYDRCIRVWGEDMQIKMCIEEMSELTKELCKYYRKGEMNCDQEQKDHICEEIADVMNMIGQMRKMFGSEKVDEIEQQKIVRTNKLLDEIEKNKKEG